MDDRKLDVLRAIVTDYVSSREPVGSKALVDRHQLNVSPATVRNDMAVLEEEGYITQPHTSAGRIPTDKGYRLFVDRLATIKPLSQGERRAIQQFMSGAADLDDIVARTVRLLAQLTQQVAIVQYPVNNSALIRHVEFVGLNPDKVLLIVISSSGRVQQHALDLPGHDEDLLAAVRASINAAVVGQSVSSAGSRLQNVVAELRPEHQRLGGAVVAVLLQLLTADPSSTRVLVGGVPNLTRFGEEFETTVKPVLEALEEQVVLLRLLGEATTGDVTVRIGGENPYSQLSTTSLVASSYAADHDSLAGLGVVGPTRMDYPSTIASVRAVARYLGRLLAEG